MSDLPETPAPQFRVFAPFSDAQLGELEEAHGRIDVVRGAIPAARRWVPDDAPEPPWEAVFRIPTDGESEFFELHAAGSEKARSAALRDLTKGIVVGVSFRGKQVICLKRTDSVSVRDVRNAWDALRKGGYPLAHVAAQDTVMALAGMGREEAGKE